MMTIDNFKSTLTCMSLFLRPLILLFFLLQITSCDSNSDAIKFIAYNHEHNPQITITNANSNQINQFFSSIDLENIYKLVLEQKNGNFLKVELGDHSTHLVALRYGYEMFIIRNELTSIEAVEDILIKYLSKKEDLMKEVDFY